MAQYRKNFVVTEAEQFWPDHKPWPEGVYKIGGELPGEEGSDLFFRIETFKGPLVVKAGDWIIVDATGERFLASRIVSPPPNPATCDMGP